jgi:hypothetical protein
MHSGRGRFRQRDVPKAGDWTITVDSRYCQTVMTPLTLKVYAPKNRQS